MEKLKAEHRMFGFKNLIYVGVAQCLMKELHAPTLVVMDNASFRNHKRRQGILAKGYHDLIPLPPYSPGLNPIKKTFGALKKRRQAMPHDTTIDQLIMSYS